MTNFAATLSWGIRATSTIGAGKNRTAEGSPLRLTQGTGSGQADQFANTTKTIGASSNATYDLYTTGSDITDVNGIAIPGRKLKLLMVWVESGGDTTGVTLGGGTDCLTLFADTSDKFKIYPGGPPFMFGSPAGVAIGTGSKNLLCANGGAVNAVLRIVLAMTSA